MFALILVVLCSLVSIQAFDQSQLVFQAGEEAKGPQSVEPLPWSVYPFNPTSIPLAVRSPYLNVWLEAGNRQRRGLITSQYASAFNGNYLPWCFGVIVDGRFPFTFMGVPGLENCLDGIAIQKSMQFTASSTTFVMEAGPLNITLNFLSPMTPNDLVRQSLPYSYINVSVTSTDGQEHEVDLYTDISAKFITHDWGAQAKWNTTIRDGLIFHQAFYAHPITYGEYDDFTTAGSVVYATDMDDATSYGIGYGPDLRTSFQSQRSLTNTIDEAWRAIEDRTPVFALHRSLGIVRSEAKSALFTLGRYRSPAINWQATSVDNPNRELYFMSKYPSLYSSLHFFHGDFPYAHEVSVGFDDELKAKSLAVSHEYYALTALAARQVFAGMEITLGRDAKGQLDTSDVMAFMKEIATSNYVNTVDIVYPSFPFFVYDDSAILKALLEPTLRYTASGKYPHPWCIHDLGFKYPNVTGHDDGNDEWMFIEETAGMLIMEAAYVMASKDISQLMAYYSVFEKWARFLAEGEALYPRDQVSSDDFQGALINSTNLAVKGIIGVAAMSELAKFADKPEDEQFFRDKAFAFAKAFQKLASSSDFSHTKITYQGQDDSWSILYHLFADKLLGTNLWDEDFYAKQGSFYITRKNEFGVPLDSRNKWAKSDWQIQAAAAHADEHEVRNTFINGVFNFLDYGISRSPFPDAYISEPVSELMFVDRPVVGSIFSVLASERLQRKRRSSPNFD